MATPNYSSISSSTPLSHRPRLNIHRTNSDPVARSNILLLGMRSPGRAGKTSILQVLFKNLPPKETFYLETTTRIVKHRIDTVIPLELWDCPANTTVASLGVPLSQFAAIIFVIDIRDLYNQPISKLVEFITASYTANPEISIEVFVHKAEKLQEDDKIENFRQIHERVMDRLSEEYEQMHLNFHLTSVYDHSLHEAFSKVLHKLIDSLPYLEELLNVFCGNSQSPKAFLFDIRSRLYFATDASPVDSATHNLCCDYLQMLNSFSPLYRSITASPERQRQLTGADALPSLSLSPPSGAPSISADPHVDAGYRNGITSPTSPVSPVTPSSPSPRPIFNGTSTHVNGSEPQTSIQQVNFNSPQPSPSTSNHNHRQHLNKSSLSAPAFLKDEKKQLFYPSASTTLSAPLSTSGGGTTLTYHLITRNLALLALIPTAVFEERRGLVEYNVVFFREGVQEICDVEDEVRGAG